MSLTITTVFIGTAIFAALWTFLTSTVFSQRKNLIVSYLQNFSGGFFIFSGIVKAVDPLGTSYKMVDYFTEFETTFAETWMSFIAPLFPFLSNYSTGFSVFMIVLEVVLGIMLLIGSNNKLASWLFFLIVGFFTFLTGFTALTGYVPEGINFFDFGNWGAFKETNMKVTDCGCFGDFLKLEPFTSFKKDLILLIPAFVFLFRTKDMHTIFSPKLRTGLVVGSIAAFSLYCFSNYVWDIPGQDFRPFRVGVDIKKQKALEEESMANAPVFYNLTHKETGEVKENLSMNEFLALYKDPTFQKDKYETDQTTAKPEIPQTKISEFGVESLEGNEISQELLDQQGYSLMYVCYTLGYEQGEKTMMVADTSFLVDTVGTPGTAEFQMVKKIDKITQRKETVTDYIFTDEYKSRFTDVVNPFAKAAQAAGVNVYAIAGKAGENVIKDFSAEVEASYPIHMADDILLKTIVRSNPGIVLLKDGAVVKKWHVKRLPSFEEIKAEYIK